MSESFTTGVVTKAYIQSDGGIPIRLTIDNQDGTNDVIYSTNKESPADTLGASPNGETEIDNMLPEGFIQITPDAITGKGILSADLAWPADLIRLGWVPKGFLVE